ncbi:MAG TPA: hypothetical protein VK462_02690, partial [Nitrososphaeraceae archaeon]|nr:hypothetical protein [Nitrososphaeraceae archaeon]
LDSYYYDPIYSYLTINLMPFFFKQIVTKYSSVGQKPPIQCSNIVLNKALFVQSACIGRGRREI